MIRILLGLVLLVQIATARQVMTWVPPYGISAAQTNLQTTGMGDAITRIGLQFWNMSSSGAIAFHNDGGTASAQDVAWFVNWANTNGVTPLLTVVNIEGGWTWAPVKAVIDNPSVRATAVANLVNTAKNYGLGGVDIDFETLNDTKAGDKANFILFISELSTALHNEGMILAINTFAAQYHAPNWNWWSDLLPHVDAIQSMGYEDIGYLCNSNSFCGYDDQLNKAGGNRDKLILGVPGQVDTWLGRSSLSHLQGAKTLDMGVAIWSAHNLTSTWKSSSIINQLQSIKGASDGGLSSVAVSSSAAVSSSTNSTGFGTVLSDFSVASQFDGNASTAGGNYLNGFWSADDDQASGGSSTITAYNASASQWYRLNEGLSIADCPTGDSVTPTESDCFFGWNMLDAIDNDNLSAKLSISEYINPTGWGWASAGWWYIFDGTEFGTASPAGLNSNSSFQLTTSIPTGKTISLVLYETTYEEASASGSRPTFQIVGTGSEQTYTVQVQNFAPTWGTGTTDVANIIALGILRNEGATTQGDAIGAAAGEWEIKIRKFCLNGDCQGDEETQVSSSSQTSSEVLSSSSIVVSSAVTSSSSIVVSSSSEVSSSSVVSTGFGKVLSDFAVASQFDGQASTAGGNYLNGFWSADDDQSNGGASTITAYNAAASEWYRLNAGLSIAECPTGDSATPTESDCFFGWNMMDAIDNDNLSAKLTITEYVNPTGWGWASAGWWYLFDGTDFNTASPAGLTANSSFQVTTTVPTGKTLSLVLYETTYVEANGSRPTFQIVGTGSEQTYTVQVQNFAPTWGSTTTDPANIIALGFLRNEGAASQGEAIGAAAGEWELKIRKLCLDGDCEGEEESTVSLTERLASQNTFSIAQANEYGLMIRSESNSPVRTQLVNTAGQILESHTSQGQVQWNQVLNSGIYFIQVQQAGQMQSQRLIIP